MKNPFVIRASNLTQLARIYKVSLPTMKTWAAPVLKKFGKLKTRILTTRQVQLIVRHIGLPEVALR